MNRKILDPLDKQLISVLSEDAQISVRDLAKRLSVTTPTIRARIKNLKETGILKIVGLIDTNNHPNIISALIGLSIQSYGKLNEEVEKLANLDQVVWVGVISGRYDVIAEVVVSGGMSELNDLLTKIIPKLSRVVRSETFIVMKSKNKWIPLPKGLGSW